MKNDQLCRCRECGVATNFGFMVMEPLVVLTAKLGRRPIMADVEHHLLCRVCSATMVRQGKKFFPAPAQVAIIREEEKRDEIRYKHRLWRETQSVGSAPRLKRGQRRPGVHA